MTDKELMQMVLDALRICIPDYDRQAKRVVELQRQHMDAITALRARLAQPEPQSVRERVDETLVALAEAEAKNTLICPKCKADRFKVDCQGDRMNCGLTMEAQTEGCSTCGIKGIHACLGKKPEPVGYVYSEAWTPIKKAAINGDIPNGTPLYTAPPQREWVGLTADEIVPLINLIDTDRTAAVLGVMDFARAVEALVKEKNT